ncbi:MAG: LrgB family protein [Burkholderiales bacterium]|jgi:predicted murein hydrolase (TIGR00659 family)|nr:LrgB family protein [Rhodocyclaceae bacterium]MCE2722884.1 LrgB family protein [Betaproteobacteria bacterium]MCA3020076.1 LrgB family protein [Rhodocyclaceae bacterium]MCA3020565.1 LrgB family protein [Rhodocyclaceae bacterium]MCA3023755.1 LrgB family protein [Rhodocyclaceae bacterium]
MSANTIVPTGLDKLAEIWVYLSATPLFGLTLTLVAYVIADAVYQRTNKFPLANPVLISVALIVTVLSASGTSYQTYFQGAQFVHFLLGTATVALAVPLARLWNELASRALPLLTGMFVGATVSVLVALGVAKLFAAPPTMMASLLPKSVTAPIAMGIAEQIGGSPTLAAVFAISTGIFGALIATPLLNALGIRDWSQRGFAVGVAAHGIGTARAYSVDPRAGAYASLGMGLHALLGAMLLPWVARWFL